jgi:hypothetical protein
LPNSSTGSEVKQKKAPKTIPIDSVLNTGLNFVFTFNFIFLKAAFVSLCRGGLFMTASNFMPLSDIVLLFVVLPGF